ncbi:MAG: 50S ribosomal protein L29 [Candidatus Dadabacteria bacterium]|nr:50S ribosomal protein L29 [Candidatus Dadabacteria bacterium]
MNAEQFRNLTDEELAKKEDDLRQEIFNLRVQFATQRSTNVARMGLLKKDFARILTVKRERELEIRR